MEKDGVEFLLKKVGIRPGFKVLDFGCNEGHYTIPLAKIVGPKGIVYAADKSEYELNRLKQNLKKYSINNVKIINTKGGHEIPVPNCFFDAVLTYDVLHFMDRDERNKLYIELYRILKSGGLYSVYPKHNKNDWPMWHLADVEESEIVREITSVGFKTAGNFRTELFHDDDFDTGSIYNFKK